MDNLTHSSIYTLMEPKDSKSFRHIYFTCFLFLYIMILFVNVWLSVVIVVERALHEPMYIFLCNLCLNGIYGAAGFYPKFLHDVILDSYMFPSHMCGVQAFVIYTSIKCEYCTLAVMAYDRHVAICKPLDYHSKMNRSACVLLLAFCWIVPFATMLISVSLSNRLTLCKNHIEKLYCDNWSMVKLSCESTITNNIYGFLVIFFFFLLFVVIIVSYIKLAIACKASLECRRRWLFDMMFSRYGSSDFPEDLRHFLALEIIIVPPLFNPTIYGLKVKEIRKRLLKPCNNIIKVSG